MAAMTPLTSYKPNVSNELAQALRLYTTWVRTTRLPSTLRWTTHIRNMLASPLYLQEREASADLPQVYHSIEESLLLSSQSISTSAEKPVALMSQKRKSRQELNNDRIRMLLEDQKERFLSEAKSKIVKHECRIELADISIRELNRQIETQRVEIGHTTTGYSQSSREHSLLHEELAVRERALRETRIGGIHEIEELKRLQESRVDEIARRKLIENQDTINELTARIQELQNDVSGRNDSRDGQGDGVPKGCP